MRNVIHQHMDGATVTEHLCLVAQSFLTLWDPIAHQASLREFSRQEYWSGLPCPPPGALPSPGIEPRSPALQADYSLSEPPGKPKNTGVGSLFLLQEIFPTQESNQSHLHVMWILYESSVKVGIIWAFILVIYVLNLYFWFKKLKNEICIPLFGSRVLKNSASDSETSSS